ncbi:MAG TPA: glycosyltransferase [Caldilineaceae bacterium]|nr:glycosyltransferase [Caldilineaceae bacterium]
MHVVLVSKAMVVGTYRRKAEAIARCGVELTVLAPPAWRDRRGEQVAAPHHAAGYAFHILPIRFNGSFHLHYYPTLGRELRRLRPDLLHMDEEPYNLATYLALAEARRLKVPALFFTWQNLYRRYPPPFAWFEQANYRRAAYAIAGSQEAAAVLARKGYRGPLAVLPQFGVDPTFFRPAPDLPTAGGPLRIGYAGGLLPEKGVDLLLRACAGLAGDWRLAIVGEGSEQAALAGLAEALNIRERVSLAPRLPGEAMPGFYQGLDVFVLPSRTRPNWKEQFGRVLVEAMACGVAVVGSDTGEIPHVIGDAGLLFAENDVEALRAQLQRLLDDPAARADLAARGRDRVLAHFTMDQVAARTVEIYREILGESRRGERDA